MIKKLLSSPILEGSAVTTSAASMFLELGMIPVIAPLYLTFAFTRFDRDRAQQKLEKQLQQKDNKIEQLEKFNQEAIIPQTQEIKNLVENLIQQATQEETNPEPSPTATQRSQIGVFIDHKNLEHTSKFQIDYKAFLSTLKGNATLEGAWFYTRIYRNHTGQRRFHTFLECNGYHVKEQRVNQNSISSNQLAIDLEKFANQADTIVLVSSDEKYTSVLEKLKAQGKQIEIVGYRTETNEQLIEIADRFISLESIKDKIVRNR